MSLQRDPFKSWCVTKEFDGWYYWNSSGDPTGPMSSKSEAEFSLESYEYYYYHPEQNDSI